jgi:hypothetical protein
VDVLWSGLTDVIGPNGNIVQAPWGIDPRAVKISPGTTVTWTWFDEMWGEDLPGGPFPPLDIHHLVSYFDPPYEDEFRLPPELLSESQDEEDGEVDHDHEHPGGEDEFYLRKDPGESFSHTFDEVGTYFYFCIPHGVPSGELGDFPKNLFGQRGVVKVVDD